MSRSDNLKEMLRHEDRKIENYNKSLELNPKKIIIVDDEHENKKSLKSISWQLYEIDREAIEDFRRNYDCTYQDIIKYALRYYLSEKNYRHAEELIELRKKHDEENEI